MTCPTWVVYLNVIKKIVFKIIFIVNMITQDVSIVFYDKIPSICLIFTIPQLTGFHAESSIHKQSLNFSFVERMMMRKVKSERI